MSSTVVPPAHSRPDQLPRPAAGGRIEPRGRLVEEQQVRIADDAEGEVEAAALATGQAVAALADGVLEADQGDALLDRPRCVDSTAPYSASTSPTVSTRSMPEDCRTMPMRSRSERSRSPGSRPSTETDPDVRVPEPLEDLHRRRLARPVLAEQAVDLAGGDRERHPSTAGTPPYRLTRPDDLDDRGGAHSMFLNDGEVIGRPVSLRRCSAVGRK